MSPGAPRIAAVTSHVDGNAMYLLIESITLVKPPPEDLSGRICQAVICLSQIPPPPGHSLGPLGGGRLCHRVFKDSRACLDFSNKESLNAYLQKAYTKLPKRLVVAKKMNPVSIIDDRLMCVQADMHESNFGVDEAGRTVVMDFGAVGWLPESFAAFTLGSGRFRPAAVALGLSDNTNVNTLAEIAWLLHMLSDPTLGSFRHAPQQSVLGVERTKLYVEFGELRRPACCSSSPSSSLISRSDRVVAVVVD